MLLNERKRAVKNAIALLEKHGALVLQSSTGEPRPIIDIASPTPELWSKAIEVTEKVDGCLTTMYILSERVCGCLVRWRSGGIKGAA